MNHKPSKQRRVLLILLLCVPLCTAAGRQTEEDIEYTIPSVSLTLLSDKPLTIGDPIDLALTVYHGKKEAIVYPEESIDFAPFTLRDLSVKNKKVGSQSVRTIVLYSISIFQTGDVVLNPLNVSVGDASLATDALTIRILSVLPADDVDPELMDIVPPFKARIKAMTVLYILLGVFIAAGAFIVVRKYLIHPKAVPKTIIESDSSFDPYEYSIRELETIRKEHRAEQADTKKVYSTITHSLKLFFGSLFTVQALEMTTSELKRYLRRSGARRRKYVQPNRLINILHRSDMVKFAKESPPHGRVEQDIDQSIDIIREAQEKVQGTKPPSFRAEAKEHGNAV